MSDKNQILEYVHNLGKEKLITRDELLSAFDSGQNGSATLSKKVSIQDIMYYIGAAIVFFGLVIMVGQNWESMADATKVLVTLGSGIIAYISGTLFARNKGTEKVGVAFHLIAALIIPVGIAVTFDVAGMDVGQPYFQTLISGMLFAVYIASYFLFKKDLFVLFTIIFGSWFFYAVSGWMMSDTVVFEDSKFFEYQALILGLSYVLLGHYFSFTEDKKSLIGFLYGFGVFVFLAAALALGGWEPDQNVFWELIYPVIVFGVLFMSVVIKRTSFLTFGTIFLMLYILKITSEYFSTGLGWPLALVCAGFMLIGTGYASFYVKKRYFGKS